MRTAAVLLLLLAGCQNMPGDNALPACTHHCTVVAIGSQDRGGNSPTTTAQIPLVP